MLLLENNQLSGWLEYLCFALGLVGDYFLTAACPIYAFIPHY